MLPEHLEYGLLGEHLGHSFSPAIHKQLGDYSYQLIELPPDQVGEFFRAGNFRGLNVTIPYKKTVMDYCQALTAPSTGTTPTTTDFCTCSSPPAPR